MSSTYSLRSSVFLRNIPSGKSFNWLFCKYLLTNNHNHCQLIPLDIRTVDTASDGLIGNFVE